MSDSKEIRRDRLKIRFVRPEGEISRRELLKLVLPRYEVVPFIEPASCRGSQECGLCLNTCPLKAIKVEAGEVIVDTALCRGCGGCVAACPHRAIVYPTFALEQLDKEMEKLLLRQDAVLEPRIIALICQNCVPASDKDRTASFAYQSNVLPLELPCLAMASPWLMLRAFDRGVQGLVFISSRRKCLVKFDSNRWQENIQFVQGLLGCWDIEPDRIGIFDVAEKDPPNIARKLDQFAKKIAELAPTLLRISEPTLVPDDGLLLPALIKDLSSKLRRSSKGVVTAGMVPFAKVELDNSQCSGCGLCALGCPTGALTASSSKEADTYLLFRHDLCVACDRCVEVCPEKCLRLERILELDKMDSPAAVLFEDSLARCRQCGNIMGSRAMINRLQIKLLAMGESLAAQFELCPTCKIKAQFNLGRTTLEPTDKPD